MNQLFKNLLGFNELYSYSPEFLLLLFIVSIWSLIWKGFALWKAAKSNHRIWFIVFLIFNTVGLLEILYLFFLARRGKIKNID